MQFVKSHQHDWKVQSALSLNSTHRLENHVGKI